MNYAKLKWIASENGGLKLKPPPFRDSSQQLLYPAEGLPRQPGRGHLHLLLIGGDARCMSTSVAVFNL